MSYNPNHKIRPGFRVTVYEPVPGELFLHIMEHEDEEGNQEGRDIPLAGIASRRELLGIDDPVAVVEAMIHMQDYGIPPHCEVTGRNAYTDPYTLLYEREHQRSQEAALAEEEGDGRARLLSRANQAAYDSVHQPINGGRCALDRARAQARQEIGLNDPAGECGVETRLVAPEIKPGPSAMMAGQGFLPLSPINERREQIADALRGHEEVLLQYTQRFLRGISGRDKDLISPEAHPEPVYNATAEELLARFEEDA